MFSDNKYEVLKINRFVIQINRFDLKSLDL